MYFLKKLFHKKGYQFVGRGGVKYFDGRTEYFIGSENYQSNKLSKHGFAVVLFRDGQVPDEILSDLSELLQSDGIIVETLPNETAKK